jgi:putative ABC transport system permease protein
VRQANLDEEPAATLYRPYLQLVEHDMFFMVRARTSADAVHVAMQLPEHLRAVDPSREWWQVRAMDQVIDESDSIKVRRFVLILLGTFASLALLLAGVGLYGVMAYFVAERRHEIAVRVALGASRRAVLEQVLMEAVRLLAAGLVLGGIAAHSLTRLISSMLYGVTASDAPTYLVVACLLGAVALLASYLPARRATQVDPILALREP